MESTGAGEAKEPPPESDVVYLSCKADSLVQLGAILPKIRTPYEELLKTLASLRKERQRTTDKIGVLTDGLVNQDVEIRRLEGRVEEMRQKGEV